MIRRIDGGVPERRYFIIVEVKFVDGIAIWSELLPGPIYDIAEALRLCSGERESARQSQTPGLYFLRRDNEELMVT